MRDLVTLVVCLVCALGVRDLPEDGSALVVRHGHADRDLYVLGRLDWDLLADLLGQDLAARVVRAGPPGDSRAPDSTWGRRIQPFVQLSTFLFFTVNVSISHGSVTNPLMNRMTLGLVVQLEKVLAFCDKTS